MSKRNSFTKEKTHKVLEHVVGFGGVNKDQPSHYAICPKQTAIDYIFRARVASQTPSTDSKGYCNAIPKDKRRFRERVHAFPIGPLGTSVQTLAF